MNQQRLAFGLRRDLARVEAVMRAADEMPEDERSKRVAFAAACEAEVILATIADVEGISLIGLRTERLPWEALA